MYEFTPDVQRIVPMEYTSRSHSAGHQGGNPLRNDMQCVWVGLAAIAIVYLMGEQGRMSRMRREFLQPVHAVAGMLTSVVGGISAKVTEGIHSNTALIDACKVFPKMKCGLVSLIDNTKNLANPREPTPEEVKRKNYETLVKFVNDPKQPRACIVVFAHWCPHCHTLINELVDKANSIKGNGVQYLLVNGESVHADAFQGEKAIISLQHYPTVLCKIGNMGKEVKSIDEATRMALETNPEDVIEDTTDNTQPSLEMEEEAVEDPLAMLF